LLSFDADTAWDLGSTLRTLILEQYPDRAACISITQASTDKPIFFARTKGVAAYQISKLDGIRNAVNYLEKSTWHANHRYDGNIVPMGKDCDLTPGGYPVRVRGVEAIVAVLVVQGLGRKQEYVCVDLGPGSSTSGHAGSLDHELILEALNIVLNKQRHSQNIDAILSANEAI